ncbi:MAG: ATP-binding protein [Thermoplasmata archaeon]
MSGKSARISLTVKEKIQLHLLEYAKFSEEYSVPSEITQSGISERVGIHLKHLSQYLKPLLEGGQVEERIAHVKGKKQRQKVYSLTGPGWIGASKVKDLVLGSKISYMTASGKLREGVVAEVLEKYTKGRTIMEVLSSMDEKGLLDIGSLVAEEDGEKRLVNHTEEAPRTPGFVDRMKEIERVLSLLEERKIVVIRGLAGIGKTALASAVCSEIRGSKSLLWHQTRKWDTPTTVLLRMGRFLRALGKTMLYEHVSGGVALDLGRVEVLLEKELDGSNSIIIFDDFQHANEEVIDFFSMVEDVVEKTENASFLILSREAVPFYDRRAVMIRKTVEEIELGGLDFESAKEWMESRGVEIDHEAIYERTGGHPLFLELIGSHTGRS